MSEKKPMDRLCAVVLLGTVLLALAFSNGEALGLQQSSRVPGYASRLFDTGKVHTIEIVMDDWDSFIETCENEEYAPCSVVIDGEACRNVGIRAKGNTSLTTVSAMGSSRYSFKVEFDQYDGSNSYYGLDKLSLNNAIQDTTYMKDYLTYRLMSGFGVDAPLCSYAYLTVNGQDWGLYLAVEGVEDAFLQRNYGRDHGALYKPDSMSFGGGRGNGRDFDMAGFAAPSGTAERPEMPPENGEGGFLEGFEPPAQPGKGGGPQEFPGGMGGSDVKLQYIDDDPDSYPNIFDNAKTDVSEASKTRLIQSLKALSGQERLEEILDVEEVLRYFVVHNFVCNGDSYTGSMVHNYYLYEEDGRLSMIPWDYNLAFGTFQASDAAGAVNAPIDTPVSGGVTGDRPMVDWIFGSEAYTQLYHQYFSEFLEQTDFSALIGETAALIAPYVEKDPTKFYSYEEFETGVEALAMFCRLRSESVAGQLDGTIPSTASGQSSDPSALVGASQLNLADMGAMETGMGGGFPGAISSGEDRRPPEQMQPPEGGSGQWEAFPEMVQPVQSGSGPLLLAVSLVVLLAGLVIAFRFRR